MQRDANFMTKNKEIDLNLLLDRLNEKKRKTDVTREFGISGFDYFLAARKKKLAFKYTLEKILGWKKPALTNKRREINLKSVVARLNTGIMLWEVSREFGISDINAYLKFRGYRLKKVFSLVDL